MVAAHGRAGLADARTFFVDTIGYCHRGAILAGARIQGSCRCNYPGLAWRCQRVRTMAMITWVWEVYPHTNAANFGNALPFRFFVMKSATIAVVRQ